MRKGDRRIGGGDRALDPVSNADVSRFERITNCIVPNVRYGFCVYGTIISGRGVSVRL